MKKFLSLLFTVILSVFSVSAEVKTITVTAPGTLSEHSEELAGVTELAVVGTINAADISTIKDLKDIITYLDLSKAGVVDNTIPSDGFSFMTNLKNIILPPTITKIDGYAFYLCTSLESIKIPDSVTEITFSVFDGCSNMSSVTFGSGLKATGVGCFRNCKTLKEVVLPENIETIGSTTFAECTALTSVTVKGAKKINSNAFQGCTALTDVNISEGTEELIGSVFYNCTALKSIVLPSTVSCIGDRCFIGCSSLAKVTLSKSLEQLGTDVFSGCSALSEIYATADMPAQEIKTNTFKGINFQTCKLYVPKGSKQLYSISSGWKNFVNIIEYDMAGIDEISVDGEPVEVYNLGGIYVGKGVIGDMQLPAGVYIVRSKTRSAKIYVK